MSVLKHSFDFLQKIGKSLMLPVAILPVAGILLGIGGALLSGVERGVLTINSQALITFFEILKSSGDPIFANLPLIFAIGVALGLTKNDGVSSLAAFVGYVVMISTMGVIAPHWGVETQSIMGIPSINTGVFGGIIIGSVAAYMFNRFYRIELPPYLGFFAGKRFVPIITAFAAIGVGFVLSLIWPPIGDAIDRFSNFAVTGSMSLTVFIYGFVERLLIPFGLHHIWNVPFFFEIGEFVTASGKVVNGELTRFFAGDPTAGNLGGGYLFKMFGLPAAALAMWQCAKEENRQRVGGIMISAALTSFLTGITEPIEFSFLFVAPILYLLHAFLAGAAFVIVYVLGAKLGYTFSHGFIDYILFFPMDTKPWIVLLVGPVYFVLYYVTFRFAIMKWNLMTPGREQDSEAAQSESTQSDRGKALEVINALGGATNIENLDACITRLRVGLHDIKLVDEQKLKDLGAVGVVKVGQGLQAIYGTQSENLKTAMEDILRNQEAQVPLKMKSQSQNIASEHRDLEPPSLKENPEIKAASLRWLEALGGKENIEKVEACAVTRLRIQVRNEKLVKSDQLTGEKLLTMRASNRVWHLLVGPESGSYKRCFDQLLT